MSHRPGRCRCPRRLASWAIALSVAGALAGCVERRYTIRTDPPGALVFVNGEEAGISPVSVNYEYYGDRRVTIQAEGYQTLNTVMPLRPPWWNNLVTEFFTENLIPWTIRDDREVVYHLAPSITPPAGDLVRHGEELRQAAQAPPPQRPGPFLRFFAP